jgi:hypothetical protein
LRQALADAQDGDTISFSVPTPASPNATTSSTITLTSGELTINKNMTISGPGANVLTVARDQSASAFRIFHVTPGHTVTIEGLTISNGADTGLGGGGMYNDHSMLTVKSCALIGNLTIAFASEGGGILNDANNGGSATLTVANSTLSGNSTTGGANCGGGIASYGPGSSECGLTVVNSTLSGNSSTLGGGGICISSGSATVANSTLSGNSAPNGTAGGIINAAVLTISNTILKTGASGINIDNRATVTSLGYNLSNDNGGGFLTATGDQINIDPMLGPLQDNGGPTLTHAPFSNSPAIDKGKDIGATGRDQRGNVRPVSFDASVTPPAGGDRSDIGAVELPPQGIYGTISYCSNPVPGPVPNVTLTLTGDATTSTMTDGSGNYQFLSLAAGGSYTVTPSKTARAPGSAGINTVDVIATQRHFLNLGTPLSGCRLTAADVNGDAAINTVDVIAIQRFFLGLSTGIANTGKYKFAPVNRSYLGIISNQTAQNYNTLVFGDVASPFVE